MRDAYTRPSLPTRRSSENCGGRKARPSPLSHIHTHTHTRETGSCKNCGEREARFSTLGVGYTRVRGRVCARARVCVCYIGYAQNPYF